MAGTFRSGYSGDRGAQKVGGSYSFAYGQWQVDGNPGKFSNLFNSFQREMIAVNTQQQQQFQDLVVTLIKQRTKRRNSSTGRLIQVTADPRNRLQGKGSALGTPSTFGWGVGNTTFLNNSVAKYWRTIEEGSAAVWKRSFVGELRTRDGQPLWGWFGAGATLGGSGSLATGPYSAPGKGSGGKFRPWYMENKSGKRTFPPKEHVRGLMITHEIAPMDAYLDAWKTIDQDVYRGWTKAWQASFGRALPGKKELFLNTPNAGARGARKR